MKVGISFRSLLSVLLLAGITAQAQTKLPPRRAGGVAPRPRVAVADGVGLKDGLSMQKGRVMLTEQGVTNPLVADKKLINGTTITPTGLVTGVDGTATQMNEGDMASLSGRISTRTSMAEADSLLKIKTFDLKYPGKRKKMAEEAERKAKVQAKREEDKAKALAKKKK